MTGYTTIVKPKKKSNETHCNVSIHFLILHQPICQVVIDGWIGIHFFVDP